MSQHSSAGSIEGLPKQFVTSLRILFDILDEDRTGYVRLCDIESRWHEEGVKGLPSGVVETLRKVAPQNGKLSFENFVTGLKLSLLKTPLTITGKENKGHHVGPEKQVLASDKNVPRRADNVPRTGRRTDKEKPKNSMQIRNEQNADNPQDRQIGRRAQQNMRMSRATAPNTVAVKPNNALNVQAQNVELRSQIYQQNREHQQVSSQLRNRSSEVVYRNPERKSEEEANDRLQGESDLYGRKDYNKYQQPRPKSEEIHRGYVPNQQRPPSRPERPPPYHHARSPELASPVVPPRNRNRRIMQDLKNWHREHKNDDARFPTSSSDSKLAEQNRISANAIYVNIDQIRQHASSIKQPAPSAGNPPKTTVRRQNSRRHTLTSGIDYNTIRRMKQLEQEKDILLQGHETAERLRDWYHKQIATVTEKQNYVEKTSCSEATLEANQERMDFQRARITELNQQLKIVMESTDKKFPAHMNLATRSDMFSIENSVQRLKNQNKLLTKEVGDKSEKITQLEKEKASLIRELFEARTKHKSSYDDTTFM